MNSIESKEVEKMEWVTPELKLMNAGSAESGELSSPDGSGQQAS